MEYNESATPSSPEGNPVQDNVGVGTVGTDESATGNSGISDSGYSSTERTRAVPLDAESVESGTVGSGAVGSGAVGAARVAAPARPRGPNASAIVIGLVAMLFAGLIIAKETMNWHLDWSRLGPGAIIGIGVVMVLIGAIGLIRRHDDV